MYLLTDIHNYIKLYYLNYIKVFQVFAHDELIQILLKLFYFRQYRVALFRQVSRMV